METRESSQLITVHIKTPKNKEAVQTAPDATVKQFKELVSQKFNAQPDKICLIFSGKILKDEETLDKLDIKDGLTVSKILYISLHLRGDTKNFNFLRNTWDKFFVC